MTLNTTGKISLAGITAGQSIQLELNGNGTSIISLNDANVRALAGVLSGTISVPTNFYGKSSQVPFTGWVEPIVTGVNNLSGVTCTPAGVFAAVGGYSNFAAASSGGGINASWPALTLMGGTNMGADSSQVYVASNSSGLCISVSSKSVVYFSKNQGGAPNKWSIAALLPVTFTSPTGIAVNSSGLFVVCGGNKGITTTTDGVTWTTPITVPGIGGFSRICCSPSGLFVAIVADTAYTTSGTITSTDGVNWSSFVPFSWGSVATNGAAIQGICASPSGRFVAVGYGGGSNEMPIYTTSVDGVNWTTVSYISSQPAALQSVICSPQGLFMAVGFSLTYYVPSTFEVGMYTTSTDGINWAPLSFIGTGTAMLNSVAVNSHGQFVAVGGRGPSSSPSVYTYSI